MRVAIDQDLHHQPRVIRRTTTNIGVVVVDRAQIQPFLDQRIDLPGRMLRSQPANRDLTWKSWTDRPITHARSPTKIINSPRAAEEPGRWIQAELTFGNEDARSLLVELSHARKRELVHPDKILGQPPFGEKLGEIFP